MNFHPQKVKCSFAHDTGSFEVTGVDGGKQLDLPPNVVCKKSSSVENGSLNVELTFGDPGPMQGKLYYTVILGVTKLKR